MLTSHPPSSPLLPPAPSLLPPQPHPLLLPLLPPPSSLLSLGVLTVLLHSKQGMLANCELDPGMDSQLATSYMRKQCSQGYYGPLCSMCVREAEDGTTYGRTTIWGCQRCKRGVAIVAAFIASNLLVLAFLWYSIHAALKDNEEDLANIGSRVRSSEMTRV